MKKGEEKKKQTKNGTNAKDPKLNWAELFWVSAF